MNRAKKTLGDLAVLGGTPAFKEPLHVGRPNIGDRHIFRQQVEDILDRRWLTNDGPYVRAFEREIELLTSAKHCVAVANATVGLEIAIRALGMAGEVIVPSMTFVATAHVLQWLGITPVFCDVDPHSLNIDPQQVEKLITSRTTGIVGVHLWGRPCPIEPLAEIASRHGLRLLYDAAHAVGCSYQGQMVGNFGDAEVFSFHATKVCNALEGGMIATNHDALAENMRSMRNFGFIGMDCVANVGINGKMNEVSAAMGLTSLASLESFVARNYYNYRSYQRELAGVPGLTLVTYDEQERNNYHYVVLLLDAELAGLKRDYLMAVLHAENVLARRYFYPGCHRMEPYRTLQPHAGENLPDTERLVEQTLCLPTGTAVTIEDTQRISQIIHFALTNHQEIRQALRQRVPPIPEQLFEAPLHMPISQNAP